MISCVSGTVEGRLESLKRLVDSIRQSVGQLPYEIILVAGACSESTHHWIEAQPDCVLIKQRTLEGAISAYDTGCSRARGEYVVILNDDTKVDGDTLTKAAAFLDSHPRVGQVAFGHRYQSRAGDKQQPRLQGAYGYVYGQCCMTRKWLGDLVGWWDLKPKLGLKHYGGDTQLSLKIWELGYEVTGVPGCSVTDWEIDDAARKHWNDDLRAANNGNHPDMAKFVAYWRGRLPKPDQWRPAVLEPILLKASRGALRTLRFKATMGVNFPTRTALIDAFGRYGPAQQANQTWAMRHHGGSNTQAAQQWFVEVAQKFQPDLIMLQAQRENNIQPETVRRMRRAVPNAYIFNWDADTHYPMLEFHWQMARECHLTLTISPDLFPWYQSHGVSNIGYWPIGVEQEFLDAKREKFKQTFDVTFLGTLYGEEVFPEAVMRRNAVVALARSGLKFHLSGLGWQHAGLQADSSLEAFTTNADLYCMSKMALSISQTAEYWGYTSDRAYNIMATGCPMLVQAFRGIEEHGLIDGETCIVWHTIKEMLEKARYYTKHNIEREAIGAAGKEVLLARHTWDKRVEELFGLIAGLGGERWRGRL